MTGPVKKMSGFAWVSRDLLADAHISGGVTDEEREWARQQAAATAAELARHLAVHARIVEHDTGLRHQVALLHAPVREGSGYVCEGCDADGPEWPCRTWRLLDTEETPHDPR